jgi:MerR family transcriptional regulator, light-induced transcriptional regulator
MELKQNRVFSPKQVGRAIGVSEASIKRWCDKGILSFTRTAGGHRRLDLNVIIAFLKDNDYVLVQPEVLGLPASVGSGPRTINQACRLFQRALEQGIEDQCFRIALDMRLAGQGMAVIADSLIAPAFHALGKRWQHGELEVYQERRGVELARRVLLRLKDTLGTPDPAAPVAIGATLGDDPYTLPGLLAELVLLELGWQARFFGNGLPCDTMAQAVADLGARMLWLSVSSLGDPDDFVPNYTQLYERCLAQNCAVVVGGSALTEVLRQQIQYASHGDNMKHLRAFAQSLYLVR